MKATVLKYVGPVKGLLAQLRQVTPAQWEYTKRLMVFVPKKNVKH